MKRAAGLAVLLFCAIGLRALDLQYGALFTVRGITLEKGRPVLPTTRGKYVNVRVLDKDTYRFLKTCTSVCVQNGAEGNVEISHIRAAKTRANMWIADVSVDKKWLLTFLVFKNEKGFSFVAPGTLEIADKDWLTRVQRMLQTRIEQGI